jgi:hypothetical protein
VDELEAAVRTVCEPIFSKPLKDISFGHVLLQLLSIAQRFDMVVQTQLILLQKTLVQVEGLGRVLYPDLDIWQTGKPVLKAWMRDQTGPRATLQAATRLVRSALWLEKLTGPQTGGRTGRFAVASPDGYRPAARRGPLTVPGRGRRHPHHRRSALAGAGNRAALGCLGSWSRWFAKSLVWKA